MGAVVQLKVVGKEPEVWTLEKQAAAINRQFELAAKGDSSSKRHRIRAGAYLIDARKMVPDGEWEAWCEKNILRSLGDIRKVMGLAGDKDPDGAAQRERDRGRRNVQAHRERAYVSAPVDVVDENDEQRPWPAKFMGEWAAMFELVRLYRSLGVEQRAQFRAEIDEIDRSQS